MFLKILEVRSVWEQMMIMMIILIEEVVLHIIEGGSREITRGCRLITPPHLIIGEGMGIVEDIEMGVNIPLRLVEEDQGHHWIEEGKCLRIIEGGMNLLPIRENEEGVGRILMIDIEVIQGVYHLISKKEGRVDIVEKKEVKPTLQRKVVAIVCRERGRCQGNKTKRSIRRKRRENQSIARNTNRDVVVVAVGVVMTLRGWSLEKKT